MYRFRDIALPMLKPASGLNGVISTRLPDIIGLRYFAEVVDFKRFSASTPTALPLLSSAPIIALSSTPRALPETIEYPWLAALRPSTSR
jgi:hypothetical protein